MFRPQVDPRHDVEPGAARAPFRVAIVGGGFAGAAAALRSIEAGNGPLAITIVEPRAELGRGIAYSTAEPGHLMNGPARSAEPLSRGAAAFRPLDRGRGGARRLDAAGRAPAGRRASRRAGTSGAMSRLASPRPPRTASGGCGCAIAAIAPSASAGSAASSSSRSPSGGTLLADAVVLASGVFQNGADRRLAGGVAGDPRYVADPYAEGGFAGLAAAAEVVILGSGLAMLDALVSLERAGFRGRVRAVSRRGGLVEPRRPVEAATTSSTGADPTLRGLVRKVQEARRRIAAEGGDWQQLVPAVRAATPGALGPARRRRPRTLRPPPPGRVEDLHPPRADRDPPARRADAAPRGG